MTLPRLFRALKDRFTSLGFWLLASTLLYAVLAFGATTHTTMWFAHFLLGISLLLLWLGTCMRLQGFAFLQPKLALLYLPILYLIGQGVWVLYGTDQIVNAPKQLGPQLVRGPIEIARDHSVDTFLLQAGLWLVPWCLCLQFPSRRTLIWLIKTIALTGMAVAIIGLTQRILGVTSIYGMFDKHHRFFFGPYRYHGNAGSLLLLTLPSCFLLFIRSLQEKYLYTRGNWFWGIGTGLLILSLFINTSKAAQGIGTVTLFALFVLHRKTLMKTIAYQNGNRFGIHRSFLYAVSVFCIATLTGLQHTLSRWADLDAAINVRQRITQICSTIAQEAGWVGFGPGMFRMVFPFFNIQSEDPLPGYWVDAHQDYLQLIIEWGFAGAFAWGFFVGGGWILCALHLRTKDLSLERTLTYQASLISVAALLCHAWIDFPMQVYSLQLLFLVHMGILWSSQAATRPTTS